MSVRNEDIQQAIVVIVEEAAAEAQDIARRTRNACFIADLIEENFSIAMPQVIGRTLEVRDIQIEVAVIVVISKRDTHRGHHRSTRTDGHPGSQADFLEGP